MRTTVTLWTDGPDGQEIGVSEFVLYEPDEARFLQRARNLFKMVERPFMPLCARLVVAGSTREVDATRAEPAMVAARLWNAYCALCECPDPLSCS